MTELEDLMVSEGKTRAQSQQDRALSRGLIAYTNRGRHLISSDTKKMEAWVARWRMKCAASPKVHPLELEMYKAVSCCNDLPKVTDYSIPADHLALVVVNFIYTSLARGGGQPQFTSNVASDLGMRVQEELVFSALKSLDPEAWERSQKYTKDSSAYIKKRAAKKHYQAQGYATRLWSVHFRAHLGAYLLEAFRQVTGHVSIYSARKPNKKWVSVVKFADSVLDYVGRSTDLDLFYQPRLTAIQKEPIPWESNLVGGFPSEKINVPFVSTGFSETQEAFYCDSDIGQALEAATILGSVRWDYSAIARDTFALLVERGEERAGLVRSTPREYPEIPPEASKEEKKRIRQRRAQTHEANSNEAALRMSYKRVVKFHGRFKPGFHFVHRADSRGRLYAVGENLNPQGYDGARGQLVFQDAKPVTEEGLRWLKIAGAAAAGQDKGTYDERVAWVEDNLEMIRAVAADPLECKDWEDVDDPFQFLAWADDFVGVLDRGEPSRYPVSLDGSNNGLQMFALLLRDRVLAEATNIAPTDRPRDIYQEVVDVVPKLMDEDTLDLGSPDRVHAERWLEFFEKQYGGRLPRSMGKRPVMTKAYNVGQFTVKTYIRDWIRSEHYEEAKGYLGSWKSVDYLGRKLWTAMEERLRGASAGMEWIKESMKIIGTEKKVAPWWHSPTGFPCFQAYYRLRMKKVKLVFGEMTRVRTIKVGDDTQCLRKMKMVNASAPNFIHSIDASLAHRVAIRMREEIPGCSLRFIHDSFGTHASDVPVLARVIREELARLMEDDLLGGLKKQWEERYEVDLPELPAYGNLDPREVLAAEYAYS